MGTDDRRSILNTDWVIKVSKLCNLRCRYCYEWNELANKERMSFDLWEKILVAIRDHCLQATQRYDVDGCAANIIWHGGEPLLLPLDYYERVMELQRKILPIEWIEDGFISNQMQTNFYSVNEEQIDFLIEEGIGIGVSYDGVPGVRLTVGQKSSDDRVVANLEHYAADGVHLGLILVLAGHTAPHITDIYDRVKNHVQNMRILPLFNGPAERPMDGINLSHEAANDALCRLFVHWFEDGCPIQVVPLEPYFTTVVMQRLGLRRARYDRRISGDAVLVINTDGGVFLPNSRYGEQRELGNLHRDRLEDIFASEAYRRSLEQDDAARAAVCASCEFLGACNTYPIFASDDGGIDQGQCLTAQPVYRFMDQYLTDNGFDDATLREMFVEYSQPESMSA